MFWPESVLGLVYCIFDQRKRKLSTWNTGLRPWKRLVALEKDMEKLWNFVYWGLCGHWLRLFLSSFLPVTIWFNDEKTVRGSWVVFYRLNCFMESWSISRLSLWAENKFQAWVFLSACSSAVVSTLIQWDLLIRSSLTVNPPYKKAKNLVPSKVFFVMTYESSDIRILLIRNPSYRNVNFWSHRGR